MSGPTTDSAWGGGLVNGYRARWRGGDYPASPDGDLLRLYTATPVPGFEQVRTGRYRCLVPAAEVEWFGYVRTVATLRGEPVVLVAERDGRVLVEYLGPAADGPAWWGASRPAEPGVYRVWAVSSELRDVRQERT